MFEYNIKKSNHNHISLFIKILINLWNFFKLLKTKKGMIRKINTKVLIVPAVLFLSKNYVG